MRKVFILLIVFCLLFISKYSYPDDDNNLVKTLTKEDILSESIGSTYLGYPASNLEVFDDELFVFVPKIGILFIDTSQHYLNIRSILKISDPYFLSESVRLAADQNFLYLFRSCYYYEPCSEGFKLMIIDKSKLENPRIVKTITLDQEIQRIEGDESYFYVLTEYFGWDRDLEDYEINTSIYVINKQTFEVQKKFDLGSYYIDMLIEEDYLFVVGNDFLILDKSNIDTLEIKNRLAFQANGISKDKNLLFLVEASWGPGHIYMFDLTNKENPEFLSEIELSYAVPAALGVIDDYLIITTTTLNNWIPYIFNIDDPRNPILIQEPGISSPPGINYTFIDGDYSNEFVYVLYSIENQETHVSMDHLSNFLPEASSFLDEKEGDGFAIYSMYCNCYPVSVNDNFLSLKIGSMGFLFFDISNKRSPEIKYWIAADGVFYYEDPFLYVVNSYFDFQNFKQINTLIVFEVFQFKPPKMRKKVKIDCDVPIVDIVANNKNIFALTLDMHNSKVELFVYDLDKDFNLTLKGRVPFGPCEHNFETRNCDLSSIGDFLSVRLYSKIYILDPDSLEILSTIDVGSNIQDYKLKNHRLFIIAENSFEIFDITDISNPSNIYSKPFSGTNYSLTIDNNYLYLIFIPPFEESPQMELFDISSDNPIKLGEIRVKNAALLAIKDGYLYFKVNHEEEDGGVFSDPFEIGYYSTLEIWPLSLSVECNSRHLEACNDESSCLQAGGFWCGSVCIPTPLQVNLKINGRDQSLTVSQDDHITISLDIHSCLGVPGYYFLVAELPTDEVYCFDYYRKVWFPCDERSPIPGYWGPTLSLDDFPIISMSCRWLPKGEYKLHFFLDNCVNYEFDKIIAEDVFYLTID